MTDRELLEAAAKAAGYDKAEFQDISGWGEVRYGLSCGMFGGDLDEYWNPLQSDTDALRLAVMLGINLEIGDVGSGDVQAGKRDFWAVEWLSPEDPFAATRRAIVRAAAAIGEKT